MSTPKVVNYTPAWLAKPSPGHDIFTSAPAKPTSSFSDQSNGQSSASKRSAKPGPRRTIARRGTEVFIAVGKEIRWADLVYLKDGWEAKQVASKSGMGKGRSSRESVESQYEEDHAQGYRTLKTQAAEDIRQLVISPHSNYIAILTTHTIHVAILPEPSQLTAADRGPMKLKSYTLGPTTHVTSQSGISSALWHPLGVNGTCLVTVTEDAVVRVWELSTTDRWSFDKPTLAIDLKKLADGVSVDQDFGASVSGVNKAFSPDSFEMEVASACFAERGSGGWSPMTLWVAMREGDVYALCPLLPEKWSPPPTLVPSLSISIVAKVAAMDDDSSISPRAKLLAQQQLEWMSEIDNQETLHVDALPGEPPAEVYSRPSKPGKVPCLQGPFELDLAPEESDNELDNLLTDLYVIGSKTDVDELMFGEDDDLDIEEINQEGLSVAVVCLLMSSGRLSICLDLDGVEAQWLPRSKSRALRLLEEADLPSLLLFEVLDTSKAGEVSKSSWPVFSHDLKSRYSFYITNTSTITFMALPWFSGLESDLERAPKGYEFRIDMLAQGQKSIRERLYIHKPIDHASPLAASTLIDDPDLGYFLLSATPHGPVALTLEPPEESFDLVRSRSRSPTYDSEPEQPLLLFEPRPVFEAGHTLEQSSALPAFMDSISQSKYQRLLKEEVRLSPATLQIMAGAHRVLSAETHRIGTAAAELFRRCHRLQEELKSQINKAKLVAERVEAITGDDVDEGPVISANERVESRIQVATQRQKDLTERIERLRKKATRGTSRELSDKEKAWIEEAKSLESKVLGEGESNDAGLRRAKEPWARYEEITHLKDDLLEQIENLAIEETVPQTPNMKVPSEVKKAKMAQIMGLLDRESALVDAAKSRLERLSLAA